MSDQLRDRIREVLTVHLGVLRARDVADEVLAALHVTDTGPDLTRRLAADIHEVQGGGLTWNAAAALAASLVARGWRTP